METAAQEKAWIAKIVGSCYFILIGFAYAIMELVSGHLTLGDLGVLLWVGLPLLINKRWMYLLFGCLNLLIWAYVAMAILVEGTGDVVGLIIISSVTFGAIVAALFLIYSAISISEKRFSLI